MKEIFKDVPNYEGMYQVSNLGNVKSLERCVEHWRGGVSVRRGRMLKLLDNGKGYLTVNLFKESKVKRSPVHQLVAIAFLNHVPNGNKIVVDHIDENPLNNRLDNLQLISNRENTVRSINKSKTSSQYIGVHWDKRHNKWKSQIYINKKTINLGRFSSELEASKAYQKALMEINNC